MKKQIPFLSGERLVAFSRQLTMLLGAGWSAEEAVGLLAEEEPRLEPLALALRSANLAAALEQSGGCPEYFLKMLRLGQETGRLDEVLPALADHYERELQLRRSLREALGWPALMLAMVLGIMALLLGKVLPLFDQALRQLGSGLTGGARLVMELDALCWALLGVLILLALLVWRRPDGCIRAVLKLPFFRKLRRSVRISRLTGALSLGLSSGLSAQYSLELAGELTADPDLAPTLTAVKEQLDEGLDLAEALRSSGLLTGSEGRTVLVAARTGHMDTALAQISRDRREEADRTVDRAVALIEPVTVAVLCAAVAALMLSVLLPALSLLHTI
ncbi:MAG: type II secretion system F family protein [Clostridia bacterium]|nr:type II secretion system F family protein [Clostridia bacterium]